MDSAVYAIDTEINKKTNAVLNILIVAAGITIQTQVLFFKYFFLAAAVMLVCLSAFILFRQKCVLPFIRKNLLFLIFVTYVVVLVTVKKILSFGNPASPSVLSGYGEIVSFMFGVLLTSVYSRKKVIIFFASYTVSFAVLFLFTGFDTLYDFGNICRTVGAFLNPNVLAQYATASMFFSLILFNYGKSSLRSVFLVTASVSCAAAVNSASRSIFLGIIFAAAAALIVFLVYLLLKKNNFPRISAKGAASAALFLLLSVLFVFVYIPKPENAVIDYMSGQEGEDKEADTNIFRGIFSEDEDQKPVQNDRRWGIWKGYLGRIEEYFLFGNEDSGTEVLYLENMGREFAPHNMLISCLFRYGIFGLILFTAVLLKIACTVLKLGRADLLNMLLFMCYCGMLLYGLLHEITKISVFWPAALCFLNYSKLSDDNSGLVLNSNKSIGGADAGKLPN